MSLLEDAQYVLRMVLGYFGVPPEMLVPVWDSRLCGQYRSIVRMIGSNLPLQPMPRVYLQMPLYTSRPHTNVDVAMETPAIPSFADILWVLEDDADILAKTRNHRPPTTFADGNARRRRRPAGGQQTQPEALLKISALESELLKLRAQIAAIVTAAEATAGTPVMSPVPAAALTSTPRCAPRTAPPPPPVPPPPPPSCPGASSVTELIRRRKGADKKPIQAVLSLPSMLDVLKDLNQVKLRAVQRSPGGTPVQRRRSKGGGATAKDPAALIAEALKRKFAQNRHNNSSDKENSVESSPFGSPDTPKMFHHAGRSHTRLHL
ncbi:mitochondrial fission regulator 2 [Vanacampus margaritifer]